LLSVPGTLEIIYQKVKIIYPKLSVNRGLAFNMSVEQRKVKRIKIKKHNPPTFKNRLTRLVKHRYISNTWLRNTVIITWIILLIFVAYFQQSIMSSIRTPEESSYDKDRKNLEALKNEETRRKAMKEQVENGQ
jgi:hypothetical protein